MARRQAVRSQSKNGRESQQPHGQCKRGGPSIAPCRVDDEAGKWRPEKRGNARRGEEDAENRAEALKSEQLDQNDRHKRNSHTVAQPKDGGERQSQPYAEATSHIT